MLFVLCMDGNMVILEDIVEENDVVNEEKVIDMFLGYLNLNFVEFSSEDIVYSFGVDVLKIEIVIERVELSCMNFGGFVFKIFVYKIKEIDYDRVIKKIMN